MGGTVYLVGGWDGSMANSTICATTDGRTFTVAGQLPAALRYPAVAAVGSDLVIAGGGDAKDHPVANVYRFDTTTGKATSLANLPAPVGHAAAFAMGGDVYVAGGSDSSGTAVDVVSAVDPAAGTVAPAASLPRPVSDAAVATTRTDAWLIGGLRERAVEDVVKASLVTSAPPATGSPAASSSSAVSSGSASPLVDPATVRPFAGNLLIADRGNDRLLVLDPSGKVIWRYPTHRSRHRPSPSTIRTTLSGCTGATPSS